MKRMITVLFAMVLAVALLAGCGGEQETVAATEAGPVVVTNVDELLAAIASDTEILMEAGTYNLSDASDYGSEAGGQYYSWQQSGDGYELKLRGVQDLTIRGSGIGITELVTDPRYSNVLVLQNCINVTLEDFTAGHTEAGECSGGVVSLLGCMDVRLGGLGLYGCGTTGVQMEACSSIIITDCDIYDCSSVGIWASQTDGLSIENCKLHDLGQVQYGGATVFWLEQSTDVAITGCEVTDNNAYCLISSYPGAGIEIRNSDFARNRVENAVFDVVDSGMVLDGNTFEANNIRNWFVSAEGSVVDGEGKELTGDELDSLYNPPVEKAPAGEQTQVQVSTVDELLAAIAPDTEIILVEEMYDLSTASDYGTGFTDYYYWEEEFDGPNLVITNVDNLTIRSEDGDPKAHTVAAIPRYAHIFTFSRCTNITLSGFTAGHTVEPGSCIGGVLKFLDSDGILVENCGLYGCGILGVHAELCSDVTVKDCEIYECSYGGIQMYDVRDAAIQNCIFRDLGGDSLVFNGCRDVTIDGETVAGNYRSNDYEY